MGLIRDIFAGRSSALLDAAAASTDLAPAASPAFGVTIDPGVLYGVQSIDEALTWINGTQRVSRSVAMQVPAIKKARDLICNGIGQLPLVMYGPDGSAVDWALFNQFEAGIARSVSLTRIVEDMLFDARAWLHTTHIGWHNLPVEVLRLEAETVTVQPKLVNVGYGTATVWPDVPGLTRVDSPNDGLLSLGRAIRTLVLLESGALNSVLGLPPNDYFSPAEGVDPADDDEIVAILDGWQTARQQRRTAYVPAALEYHSNAFNPEQLQLVQAREFAITEIARMTGIDAEELSVPTTSRTYFNGQDRGRERVRNILGPYMRAIEDRFSMDDVTPRLHVVKFDPSAYFQMDDLAAAQADEILVRSKILTRDEARGKRGLEALGEPAPSQEDSVAASRQSVHTFDDAEPALRLDAPGAQAFEVDVEKRTIRGLAVPYGRVAKSGGRKYRFGPQSLAFSDISRVKMWVGHDRERAIGVMFEASSKSDGMYAAWRIARGPEGDHALSMAEDGVWDGLSVGLGDGGTFTLAKDGVYEVHQAPWMETSLTPAPAFDDARVHSVAASAVQKEGIVMSENETAEVEAAASFSATDGQALQAQVQSLSAKLAEMEKIKIPVGPGTAQFEVREEPIYRFAGTEGAPSGYDFAQDLLAAAKDGDGAALARLQAFTAEHLGPKFVTTANVDEVNPSQYQPGMFLGQAPVPASPLYDCFHKGGLSNVTPFFWSKLDRSGTTAAVADHVEGTDPTLTTLVTAAGATVTPSPVSGRVHITREVGDQGGNPQVSGLVWAEFERSFSIALETKTAALVTAALASITALATITTGTTGLAAGAAVEAGLVDLQFIPDGFRFTRAFGHVDLYKALAGATLTTTGEKVYPIINPSNRNGVAGDKFAFIDIAGYRMQPAASLGVAGGTKNSIVADPNAVHVWNSGLTRLDKLTEKVEGWDLGVFAYWAGVVYDVTGLRKITYTP